MAGDFAKGKHLVTSQCGRSKKLSQPKHIFFFGKKVMKILCYFRRVLGKT